MITIRQFTTSFIRQADKVAATTTKVKVGKVPKVAKVPKASGVTPGNDKGDNKRISPAEYLSQMKQQELEQQEFKSTLLTGEYPYDPKILSKDVPINVELLKYKAIRLPKTHGHEIATIKFRGYEELDLKLAGDFASRAAFFLGIPVSSVIKQKTEKRLYTVIKSPFAQAKTKQNFHRTTYNYKLIGYDANPEVVDLWLSYINKYAIEGVQYSAKIHTRESGDFVKQLDDIKDIKIPETYKDSDDPIMAKVEELLASDEFKKHL